MATSSSLSLLKIWKHFHDEAFGHERPPQPLLPITADPGDDRCALQGWGIQVLPQLRFQLLQHTSAWVTRSVLRGIGPERQSCSFDVRRLCKLSRSPAPFVELGPCNLIHMAILATMFLLREVEDTTARLSSWGLSMQDKEFTWRLLGS